MVGETAFGVVDLRGAHAEVEERARKAGIRPENVGDDRREPVEAGLLDRGTAGQPGEACGRELDGTPVLVEAEEVDVGPRR